MLLLTPQESSVLCRVVQYRFISLETKLQLLSELSPKAEEIGRVILKQITSDDQEVNAAAAALQQWHDANLQTGRRQKKMTRDMIRKTRRLLRRS
jgi:hypothetical protein